MAAFTFQKVMTDGITTDYFLSDVKSDLLWTHSVSSTQFKVIPFSNVTEDHLSHSKEIYEQYKQIINPSTDPRIQVGFFET